LRVKIRNISAVQRPIPFTFTSASMTSSSLIEASRRVGMALVRK